MAASFVKTGSRVCDVGTDHGYLPVFLYKSGKCKSVMATEINKKPFLNARKTFESEKADIPLYLCDGLDLIGENDADTIIIAGMGGDVISGIISRAPWLKKSGVSLILQPMTAADTLREYLAKNGFKVTREEAVCDSGRLYSVMEAIFCGKAYKLRPAAGRIGEIKPTSEDNIAYLKRQKRLCAELCAKLSAVPQKAELLNEEKTALKEINTLLGE